MEKEEETEEEKKEEEERPIERPEAGTLPVVQRLSFFLLLDPSAASSLSRDRDWDGRGREKAEEKDPFNSCF